MDVAPAKPAPKLGVESTYRWVILLISLLAQVGAAATGQAVPIFGYFMQVELGLTRAQLGLLQTALALGQVLVLTSSGFVVDRVGVRRMFLAGAAVIGFFLLATALGHSFLVALITLTLVGTGSALVNPATAKAIIHWFPPRIRATAMSIKQTGVPVGGVLTAAIMPSLALAFGWRANVIGMGLIIISFGILGFVLYRDAPHASGARAVSRPGGLREMLRLLRRRDVLIVGIFACPLGAAQFALATYTILYLKEDFGYSVVLGGIVLSLINVSGIGGRIIWGLASDYIFRSDRRKTLLCLVAVSVVVMSALAVLPVDTPFWVVGVIAVLSGATAVSWNGVWMTQVTELSGQEQAGAVSGIGLTMGQLGIMFGPPLFGMVVDSTGSYRVGWLLMAAFSAVAWLLLASLRSRPRTD